LDQYPFGPLNRIVMMGSWVYHQQVAMAVDAPAVVELMMQRLMADDY